MYFPDTSRGGCLAISHCILELALFLFDPMKGVKSPPVRNQHGAFACINKEHSVRRSSPKVAVIFVVVVVIEMIIIITLVFPSIGSIPVIFQRPVRAPTSEKCR